MRACRTDKGVHAAGQVVSVKMLVKTTEEQDERKALEDTVSRLNQLLPKDMRIFDIKRTVSSFHAKERCDSRFYEYLLPTYAVAAASPEPYLNPVPRPFEEQSPSNSTIDGESGKKQKTKKDADSDDEAQELEEKEDDEAPTTTTAIKSSGEWISKLTEEEQHLINTYRIDPQTKTRLKELLSLYVGSHCYHNFTIGKNAKDPSCRRHIFDVILGEPFVRDGLEWISIVFHGQSFMLHQIRKMVGLVIMSMRLNCRMQIVKDCLLPSVKVNIPKAPALGLLLDKAIFRAYNTKVATTNATLVAIDFDCYDEARKRLKDELIYPKIHGEEHQFNRFMGWLRCNDEHASEFSFLRPYIQSKEEQKNVEEGDNKVEKIEN